MKKITLSPQEMALIIDAGIDTSNASMVWITNKYNSQEPRLCTAKTYDDRKLIDANQGAAIPAFTFTDIVDRLPKYLVIDDVAYFLTIAIDATGYVITYCTDHINDILFSTASENSMLDAGFDMLMWCSDNGYLKPKEDGNN